MTSGEQPVVGWRLWKLHGEGLRSWAVQEDWEPGPNEARCLTNGRAMTLLNPGGGRCARSPGTDCRCGLWALWDFGACARKARLESAEWERGNVVMGLIAGWGTVAIHGDQGFRSQYAAVRCLFTDAVAMPSMGGAAPRLGRWERLLRRLHAGGPGFERADCLQRAAARYGVPLLSLADALRMGVLSELGVTRSQVRDLVVELPG
jgi:hypothetical protein